MAIVREADDWNDLKAKVEANGGVVTVAMSVIRDSAGFSKLGRNVNAQASLQMQAHGLGHYPVSADDFPLYQWQNIRVFMKGGAVDRLYTKMFNIPDDDKKSNRDDTFIGEVANKQLREKLDQIRAIVCDE